MNAHVNVVHVQPTNSS